MCGKSLFAPWRIDLSRARQAGWYPQVPTKHADVIISHAHKYLFVELPRTGSTAISKELRAHYDGEEILKKHATYRDFLVQASANEKNYFVFSGIRNPLDKILSLYFKYKTDQRGYDNPEIFRRSNPMIAWLMRRQFRFVQSTDASFEEFFRKFYLVPYDDWSSLDHKHLNYVMHFERLSSDFAAVLEKLGLEPVRDLPVVNKTAERKGDFWSYYTPAIQRRAKWVFGPYFKRWGYEFPAEWSAPAPIGAQTAFTLANTLRHAYWRFLR